MSNKQFISNLSATYADVRKLDVKKINLKGKDILEHIKENVPTIKHSQDTRETVTENDLWGQYIENKSDGTIIVHDDEITELTQSWKNQKYSLYKIENNKGYTASYNSYYNTVSDLAFFANIQTDMITDGEEMFMDSVLHYFKSDLSNLKNGEKMFSRSENLYEVLSNLSNLTNGEQMFSYSHIANVYYLDLSSLSNGKNMFFECRNLQTFYDDMPNLTNGEKMFCYCENFSTFEGNLQSLTNGRQMFSNTSLSNFACNRSLTNLTCGNSMFKECAFSSFDEEMPNLIDGGYMFYNCDNLQSFYSNLSSLSDGNHMFESCDNLSNFDCQYKNLSNLSNGYSMFYGCRNLISFYCSLSNLANGEYMFQGCQNLESFDSDLISLKDGTSMFQNCKKLDNFRCDLPNLSDGDNMFYGCNLIKNFESDLSSLTYGNYMFQNCYGLESFISDLSKLESGYSMFSGCSKLSSFKGDLSSLTNGQFMFSNCKLDASSVMFIAESINNLILQNTTGNLTIGINIENNPSPSEIEQQCEQFAKDASYDSWEELKQVFALKGWSVSFRFANTTTNIPYDFRNGSQNIPIPIYARIIDSEQNYAEYCNEEGTKFYNIDWGHDVTNPQDFQQFDSLEDAMRAFNVFPKENIIVTEE